MGSHIHVISRELDENETIYLRRTILVTHALFVLAMHPGIKYSAEGSHKDMWKSRVTYKLPNANIKIKATLFLSERFNLFNSLTGKAIMTRSSRILNTAPEYTIPVLFTHLAFGSSVHTAEIGIHCSVTATRKASVWHTCHASMAFVALRKLCVGKIRR